MYAIIETGGKQYRVSEGDTVFVEKLNAQPDSEIKIDKVIAVGDGQKSSVGSPYLQGISVSAKVLKNGRGKKITVFTYKPKKDSKRKMGHRQPYTQLQITAINA